ncbi:MAG: DNA-binding protein in cluster with Type restriction-modification system [Ignavibacteria bacterium]|nr:DNA-binding protein in cluster with Type restriction-modification system [Ignavibacteria bacterium]
MNNKHGIVVYEDELKKFAINLMIDTETLWANQQQISQLFQTERSVITKHLRNIFNSGELDEKSVCAKFAHTSRDGKTYKTNFYNLDAIISVGYRINSLMGTKFRIWATTLLKEKILTKTRIEKNDIPEVVRLVGNIIESNEVKDDEALGLLKVILDYQYALDVLDRYDHDQLAIDSVGEVSYIRLTYDEAIQAIDKLRGKVDSSDLFAREKDNSFESSIESIYQTFDGAELYPGIEEKAANLLYFITKNHSFVDGNKRIAAFLFILFLEKNKMLYDKYGNKRLADNALVALTIMIAESNPKMKDLIIKVIVNLINKNIK